MEQTKLVAFYVLIENISVSVNYCITRVYIVNIHM